jgi:hypothetical protein
MQRIGGPFGIAGVMVMAAFATIIHASVAATPLANRPPTAHHIKIPGHLSATAWRRAYIAKFHRPPQVLRTIK